MPRIAQEYSRKRLANRRFDYSRYLPEISGSGTPILLLSLPPPAQ